MMMDLIIQLFNKLLENQPFLCFSVNKISHPVIHRKMAPIPDILRPRGEDFQGPL